MLFIDSNFHFVSKHIPVTSSVNIGILFFFGRSARPFLLVCQDAYHEVLHNGSLLLPFRTSKVAAKVVTDLNIHDVWGLGRCVCLERNYRVINEGAFSSASLNLDLCEVRDRRADCMGRHLRTLKSSAIEII